MRGTERSHLVVGEGIDWRECGGVGISWATKFTRNDDNRAML